MLVLKRTAPLLAWVLTMTGCCAPGTINAEKIEAPLLRLVDRHESYVDMDESLSDLEKRIYIRDGELLRLLMQEARKQGDK